MATVRLLALFLCLQIVSAQNPRDFKVMHVCRVLINGDWQMEMTIDTKGNSVDRIQGIDAVSGVEEEIACDTSAPFSGNPTQEISNTGDLYQLTVNIPSGTGVAAPDCGYDTPATGQYQWKFSVKTDRIDPQIILVYEKIYILDCDFNDPSKFNEEFIDSLTNLTQAPPPVVVDIVEDGRLDVVTADSLSPVNTVSAGTMTRLKASLVVATPLTPPRTGVSPFNCKACSDSSCSGSVLQLTDANGCLAVDANGNTVTLLMEPFTNTLATGDVDGAILYTGSFEIFAFSSSLGASASDVVFTCSFSYCDSTTGPNDCIDRCGTSKLRRKKREATKLGLVKERSPRQAGNQTKDDEVFVLVKVIKDSIRSRSNPVTGEFQKTSTPVVVQHVQTNAEQVVDDVECAGFTGFVIGAAVLGFALLIGAIACICLCVLLSRRQRRSDKEIAADKTNPNHY